MTNHINETQEWLEKYDYWCEQEEHAERALYRAKSELGKIVLKLAELREQSAGGPNAA